ncbi:hypothetical protein RHMOL_Rhmol13G0272900 [Rhododendron molle]|uniref:Uncharacterized protein n=1 Tax=Rhododendron molle TaxID=49168 RepID=A0ACC0LBP0_RHOML|nr:hypothetical protein RHMOL_Rhmol13G0272900 [Rhododendron molle]
MTNSWEEEVTAMEEEEEEDDQNHCDPICDKPPDEALPLILMKLSDPKSLLCCSLVSKHFANSILSHSHSLSLQFPSDSYSIPAPTLVLPYRKPKSSTRFLLKPFRFLRQITTPKPLPQPPPSQSKTISVDEDVLLFRLTKLLSRFTSLRSLRVELPCSPARFRPCKPNFQFSWVFNAGKKLTYAFLSMQSITKIGDEVEEEGSVSEPRRDSGRWSTCAVFDGHGGEECSVSEPRRKDSKWGTNLYDMASYSVCYATLINRTLLLLFSRHPNLERVEIMDSKKQGVVSLQGEQLRKLKNNMSKSTPPPADISKEAVMNLLPRLFDLWSAEELRLPRSGLVMEGVTLGAGAVNSYLDPYDRIDGLVADFENNGDDIFGEALIQIHASSSFCRQCFSIGVNHYSGKLEVESYRVPSIMDP